MKMPAVVQFHLGGMVDGSRVMVFPANLPALFNSKGILFISADYRLLFPSTPSDIVNDVRTLMSYLSDPSTLLAETLASSGYMVDKDNLIVNGVSGGNYPARAAATIADIKPRPIAWINFFGQSGDWLLDFWCQGADIEKSMPSNVHLQDMKRAEELEKMKGGEVTTEDPYIVVDGKLTSTKGRFSLFLEWQRNGVFLDYLLSEPGLSAKLAKRRYEERLAAVPVSKRSLLLPLTDATPPTYIIHGKEDHIVPIEDSMATEKNMKVMRKEVKVEWVVDAAHMLLRPSADEMKLVEGINETVQRMVDWTMGILERKAAIERLL